MRRTVVIFTLLAALLSTGCAEQVIADAARSSLTSFINTVLTTGVSNAINNP